MKNTGPTQATPKSLRLQIGLFGRTNVGKSSFLNMVAGQDVAITSPHPGTTTDVVEKVMELLPIGPVVFLDTAGMDDTSLLGVERVERSRRIFRRADVAVLILEPGKWTAYEGAIVQQAADYRIPLVAVINKADTAEPSPESLAILKGYTDQIMPCISTDGGLRDEQVILFKSLLLQIVPEDYLKPAPLVGDLLPKGGHAVFIVPIDIEAPKGRIILPQVQAIRDILDAGCSVTVVKEDDYLPLLDRYGVPPDLVVCDSQVVDRMAAETPEPIPCTTFPPSSPDSRETWRRKPGGWPGWSR